MFEFDLIQCGLAVLFLMTAGEILSHKLKAAVPAILISAVLFISLIWTGIFPSTVIEDSGLTKLTPVAIMFTLIGMGASTNPKEFLNNWRVVVLAAISYILQTVILIFVISLIFDRNTALGSLPGGAAVALIIQERAYELNYDHIAALSVLIMSVQGLVTCPIVSWMLRKEIHRYQKNGLLANISVSNETITKITDGFSKPTLDSRYSESTYQSLLRLFLTAWIASRLQILTGASQYVFCLLLGVLLASIGLLPKDEIARSKSQGLLSLMMMTMVLNGFANTTPQMIVNLLFPLSCVLLADVFSVLLITSIFGKLLHFSQPMSFSIGLNVTIGFPLNLMLSQDLIAAMVKDPDQQSFLHKEIAQRMVIAGFTSVTFLSTVGAGLLVKFMI